MKNPRKRDKMKRRQRRERASGELPRLKTYGRTTFWSDFHHRRSAVVVECDDPNYPVIAVFKFASKVERDSAQTNAKTLLSKIESNRVDYRRFAMRVPADFQWNRNYATLFEKRAPALEEDDV